MRFVNRKPISLCSFDIWLQFFAPWDVYRDPRRRLRQRSWEIRKARCNVPLPFGKLISEKSILWRGVQIASRSTSDKLVSRSKCTKSQFVESISRTNRSIIATLGRLLNDSRRIFAFYSAILRYFRVVQDSVITIYAFFRVYIRELTGRSWQSGGNVCSVFRITWLVTCVCTSLYNIVHNNLTLLIRCVCFKSPSIFRSPIQDFRK